MTRRILRALSGTVSPKLPGLSFCFILFLLGGCHCTVPLNDRQLAGKHLYEQRCAHCHRDNDLALKKIPPDLHDMFQRAALPSGVPATDINVERTVLSGKGMMPSFAGRFTQEQMAALLAYLHTGLR